MENIRRKSPIFEGKKQSNEYIFILFLNFILESDTGIPRVKWALVKTVFHRKGQFLPSNIQTRNSYNLDQFQILIPNHSPKSLRINISTFFPGNHSHRKLPTSTELSRSKLLLKNWYNSFQHGEKSVTLTLTVAVMSFKFYKVREHSNICTRL